MTPPTSIIIGPSPLKVLGRVVILSVAGTAGVSIFVVFFGFLAEPWLLAHASDIIAWTAALLACFCGIALLSAAIWGRPRVEIGPDSFTDHGALGHRSRRWSDIEGNFVVVTGRWQSVVAYRLTDAFKASAWVRPITSPAGYDEAILICGELTIGAQELAEVLNRWKQGVPSAPSSA